MLVKPGEMLTMVLLLTSQFTYILQGKIEDFFWKNNTASSSHI